MRSTDGLFLIGRPRSTRKYTSSCDRCPDDYGDVSASRIGDEGRRSGRSVGPFLFVEMMFTRATTLNVRTYLHPGRDGLTRLAVHLGAGHLPCRTEHLPHSQRGKVDLAVDAVDAVDLFSRWKPRDFRVSFSRSRGAISRRTSEIGSLSRAAEHPSHPPHPPHVPQRLKERDSRAVDALGGGPVAPSTTYRIGPPTPGNRACTGAGCAQNQKTEIIWAYATRRRRMRDDVRSEIRACSFMKPCRPPSRSVRRGDPQPVGTPRGGSGHGPCSRR